MTGINTLGLDTTIGIAEDIKKNNPPTGAKPQMSNFFSTPEKNTGGGGLSSAFLSKKDEFSINEWTNETRDTSQQRLNDGTYVDKFENYYTGTNNEERLAQGQSTTEKWANGLGKLVLKTGNVILGNTAGFVNGFVELAKQGSLSAVYDNEFTKTLDDWNTKLDYKLPNYYTQQEKDAGFVDSLGSANFWANDVLAGTAFTLGTVASEAIWAYATGGASLALKGARIGAEMGTTARSIEKMKSFLKMPLKSAAGKGGALNREGAILGSKIGEGLNTVRFGLTSASGEAAIEAWHYKKEAKEHFYDNFEELNGRQPTTEEAIDFEENLANSANAVFATNYMLVGGANLAFFGGQFGIKNPLKSLTGAMDKTLFGIGTETVEVGGKKVVQALKANKFQNVAGKAYGVTKNLFNEVILEEGLQGVTSKTANKWLESTYDNKNTAQNLDMMGMVYESMAETYGTKEGWKELGTAALTTLIGGAATGNLFGDVKAIDNKRKGMEYNAAGLNTFAGDVFVKRLAMSNQIQGAQERQKEAEAKGDVVGGEIARHDTMFSRLNFNHNIKRDSAEDISDLQDSMDLMTEEQFKEAGVSPENIEQFKTNTVEEYRALAASFSKNREFAEAITGQGQFEGHKAANINAGLTDGKNPLRTNDKSVLVEALTYNLTMGEVTGGLQADLLTEIKKQVLGNFAQNSAFNSSLDIDQIFKNASVATQKSYNNVNKRIKTASAKKEALEKELIALERTKNTREDNTAYNQRYAKVSGKLLELNNEYNELVQQRKTLLHTAKIENPFIKDDIHVSEEDLNNTEKNLGELNGLIENLKETNLPAHLKISKLISEYNRSVQQFKEFDNAAKKLSDPKYKPKDQSSFLAKILNGNKTMDEFTREFFIKTIGDYQGVKGEYLKEQAKIINEDISEADYTKFQDNKEISEELVEKLAQKVKKGEKFLPKEQELYDSKSAEIDAIAAAIIDVIEVDVNAAIEVEVKRLEKERDEKIAEIEKNKPADNTNKKLATELKVGDKVLKQKDEYVTITSIDSNIDGSVDKIITDGGVFRNVNKEPLNWELTVEGTGVESAKKDTTAEDTQKVKDEYNAKIDRLRTGKISSTDQLVQRIEKALEAHKLSMTYVGETYNDIVNIQPTQAELDEYEGYLEKINNSKRKDKNFAVRVNPDFASNTKAEIGLTKEELVKFQALNFKLSQWRMLDGAISGENESIADLIEILNQMKIAVEKSNTKNELGKQEIIDINETEEMQASDDATQNSFTQVHDVITAKVVSVKGVKIVRFSDLNIQTIKDKMEVFPIMIDPKGNRGIATPELMKEFGKKKGTQFIFEGATFTIEDRGRISVKEEEFNEVKEMLDLIPLSSSLTHSTYAPVYQKAGDSLEQVKSDFAPRTTDGGAIPYNPEANYTVNPGQEVVLQVRMDDSFNASLVAQIQSSNGKISKELAAEIERSLVIYTVVNNQITGSLKATHSTTAEGTSDINFLLIRKAAYEAFVANAKSKSPTQSFDVQVDVKAKSVMLGVPNMKVVQTEDGYEPLSIDFTEVATGQVVNTGYVLDGKSYLSRDGKGVRFDFTTKISKKNKGVKIPIVVFSYMGHQIAYPVSLITTKVEKGIEIQDILNGNLSEVEKVKKINNLLVENNIEPKQFGLTSLDKDKITAIITAMDNLNDFVDVDVLAEQGYDPKSLMEHAQITINLEDRPVAAPKLILDLGSVATKPFTEPEVTEEEKKKQSTVDELIEKEIAKNDLMISVLLKVKEAIEEKSDAAQKEYDDKIAYYNKHHYSTTSPEYKKTKKDFEAIEKKLDGEYTKVDDKLIQLQNINEELLEESFKEILTTPAEAKQAIKDLIRACK